VPSGTARLRLAPRSLPILSKTDCTPMCIQNVNAMTRQTPTKNSPVPPCGTPPRYACPQPSRPSSCPRSVHACTHWSTIKKISRESDRRRTLQPHGDTLRNLSKDSVLSVGLYALCVTFQLLHPPMGAQTRKTQSSVLSTESCSTFGQFHHFKPSTQNPPPFPIFCSPIFTRAQFTPGTGCALLCTG
jgi:hypothetical protein